MDLNSYRSFARALTLNLEQEPGVLGLVATGSMAEQSHGPDGWSDHDFWVVTEPGHQQRLRERHGWLPAAPAIVLAFQETAHGVKVVYRGGHLLEYAVFDTAELGRARVNDYRVLLDRADLERRLAELRTTTRDQVAASYGDDRWLLGQFLTQLLVGAGRYRRGEHLSAHRLVACHALEHLLRLLHRHAAPARPELRDDLDPWRRFEGIHPELGPRLLEALGKPVPEMVRLLLDLAEDSVRLRVSEVDVAAWAAVRRALADEEEAGPGI